MLWVALHFPQLEQQAIARGHASPEPARAALEAVAAWAGRFTPRVSLEPPQALALEVSGSLRYYGGARRLMAALGEGLEALGFEARSALAPTARAALWRAAGGGGPLEALPVAVLELAPEAQALLGNLGIRALGGLLALPREGVARRFGPALLRALDEARGTTAESRAFFAVPDRFEARLALPTEVSEAAQLLFAAKRLLAQMEGFLEARQAGVRRFAFTLEHEYRAATSLDYQAATSLAIGLAGPGRAAEHFARLLRERLAREPLAAPVTALALRADELEPLAPGRRSLFHDPQAGAEEWQRLVERLQARLGDKAVHGLGLRADHRPERAWAAIDPRDKTAAKEKPPDKPRPLWLLESPRPLGEGRFDLLAGPERIESGWWDEAEARRDYFIARVFSRGARPSLAWVYREREGGWFLHGLFA